jgi:hypothetical protein
MASLARVMSLALAATTTLLSLDALADKIATLHALGSAPRAEKTSIRSATETGAKGLGHDAIPESDVLQGEGAAGDKAGTSEGMIAIGKTTGADWVIEPHVASSDAGTRVELKVCQVATGRVETLARDLDPKQDPAVQMREMLALMLRPQGVGDDPLPWEKKGPAAPPPKEVLPKEKPKPTAPAAPPLIWGEHGKFSLGAAGGFGVIGVRDDRAVGRRTFGAWTVHANVALPNVRGVELTFRVGLMHGQGGAIIGDVGARYMFPLSRFAIGAGANIGGFGAFESGIAGVSLGLDPTVSLALMKNVQLELAWKNRYVPTKETSLLFTSAELAILARF